MNLIDEENIFDEEDDSVGEAVSSPQPVATTARSYCTKGYAIEELKVSRQNFEKLGLVSNGMGDNPFGYPGKMYQYNTDEVNELARHPEEIERRIKAFNDKKARQEQPIESGFTESNDWDNF